MLFPSRVAVLIERWSSWKLSSHHVGSISRWMELTERKADDLITIWAPVPYILLQSLSFCLTKVFVCFVICKPKGPDYWRPGAGEVGATCTVWVCWGCRNKALQRGWLKQQKFIFSQFWTLETSLRQGVSRTGFFSLARRQLSSPRVLTCPPLYRSVS